MTHIKICGIKTVAQAQAAVDAGATMLGFNFYPPSPRSVSPATCARIVAALHELENPPQTVGIFVNHPPAAVQAILQQCQLDLAQLSGDEPVADLQALGPVAYKAIRPAHLADALAQLDLYARDAAPALLIDARALHSYGGSGKLANWDIAREIARRVPILLAGGLTPANVADAVTQVQPWGVDVASGVEVAPGVKDSALMTSFVQAVLSSSHGVQNADIF